MKVFLMKFHTMTHGHHDNSSLSSLTIWRCSAIKYIWIGVSFSPIFTSKTDNVDLASLNFTYI